MHARSTLLSLAASVLIVGCNDNATTGAEPHTVREAGTVEHERPAIPLFTLRDEYSSIAKRIPGFAGIHVENGEVVIPVAGALPPRALVGDALRGALESRGLRQAPMRFTKVRFSFQELRRAYDAFLLGVPRNGITVSSISSRHNRISVGVENQTVAARVTQELASIGVDPEMVIIKVVPPIRTAHTLDEPFYQYSPLYPITRTGGLRIEWFHTQAGVSGCTLGFNAVVNYYRVFLTNSHCTSVRGVVQGDEYFQGEFGVHNVGIELFDPPFNTSGGVCSPAQPCRRSDAAAVGYDSERESAPGHIAKPISRATTSPGSIEIDPADSVFRVFGYTGVTQGQIVDKVGQNSGWTGGPVLEECADVTPAGTTILMVCQTIVEGYSQNGDSGSPMFTVTSGNQVQLVGIMWGGGTIDDTPVFVGSWFGWIVVEIGQLSNYTCIGC